MTGDSYRSFLVAIVLPNKGPALDWAAHNGEPQDFKAVCKSDKFKLAVLKDLEALAKEAERNGLEIVKNVHLTTTPFSTENNTMTPTQKIKRYDARKMYEEVVKEMYKNPPMNLKAADSH